MLGRRMWSTDEATCLIKLERVERLRSSQSAGRYGGAGRCSRVGEDDASDCPNWWHAFVPLSTAGGVLQCFTTLPRDATIGTGAWPRASLIQCGAPGVTPESRLARSPACCGSSPDDEINDANMQLKSHLVRVAQSVGANQFNDSETFLRETAHGHGL